MTEVDTKTRLIDAMCHALATKGFHGIGLTELLAQAEAPKGVLYHHFPAGKSALAVAAIEKSAAAMVASMHRKFLATPTKDIASILVHWFAASGQILEAQGYEFGCPLATVALESSRRDTELRAALSTAFLNFRVALCECLVLRGFEQSQAHGLATLVISAYEGALIQARVAQDAEPLRTAALALAPLLIPPAAKHFKVKSK
jgi:TetR/AcrR family transcriptional regulator, lmrAB and yxaGH operons repressor